MKHNLLAALLAALLLLAALGGLAEDAPEAPVLPEPEAVIEAAVSETPDFEMPDPPSDPQPEDEIPVEEATPLEDVEPAEADEPAEAEPVETEAPAEDAPIEADPSPEPIENVDGVDPRDCQHPVTVAVVNRSARDIRYHDLHNGSHRITGTGVLVALCADCGMAVSRKDEYVEKCSYDAAGDTRAVCQYCGHVNGDDGRHMHDFSGEAHDFCGALLDARPDPNAPELYHICRFQKVRARKCTQCDTYDDTEVVPGETIEQRETHVWQADGRCALCGYERTCRHQGGSIEDSWNEDARYTFINAAVHEYAALHCVQRCCAVCGEPLGNVEVSRVNVRQSHRFEDGVCADCGYVNVCSHPNMVYSYAVDMGGAYYTPVDELRHRAENRGGVYVTAERCPDCGFSLSGVKLAIPASQSVTLSHRFDRYGACIDCGYIAQRSADACEHPQECRIALDPSDVAALKRSCRYTVDTTASTETSHALRVEYDPSWTCALCGHREELRASRIVTVTEPHRFYKGYCVTANCGYRCAHAQVDGDRRVGAAFYDFDDASGHYLTTPTVVTGTCRVCGQYVKNHVVDKARGRRESHSMADGVCVKCGYACPHPKGELVQLLPAEDTAYYVVNENEHLVSRERVTETICKACGYTLFESVELLSERREAHSFVDDVCEMCGYDPLNDGLPTDEEDFESLPNDTRLNGVAVDDGLDMVQALARVGDALQGEVDAGRAGVEIERLSALFTPAELERLNALPLREQLLTVQCFLGFKDAVNRAANADDSLLGLSAENLIDDVQSRLDAMSPAERLAFDQARRAAFPMSTFEVMPGVTTEVLNIHLDVDHDGETSIDRYSFQNTGYKWKLVNIAVQ